MMITPPKDAIREITEKRTVNAKIFEMPKNQRHVIVSARAIHVPDDFAKFEANEKVNWTDIDNDFELVHGKYVSKNSWHIATIDPTKVGFTYVSRKGGTASITLYSLDGTPIDALTLDIRPILDGRKVYFNNVVPGLDFRIENRSSGIEIYKIIRQSFADRTIMHPL